MNLPPALIQSGVKPAELTVGSISFTALQEKMLGPTGGELALRLVNAVRVYRYGRRFGLLRKSEKMAQQAGFSPRAVPIALHSPMFEISSLEGNKDVHAMWAALFVNAASPYTADHVSPRYASLLRRLTPTKTYE